MKNKKTSNEAWKEKLATNRVSNFIAILALIISAIALPISYNANKNALDANRIAKTAELPYFKFSMDFSKGQDKILIHNEGGKLRELKNPQVYYFWSIKSDKILLNAKDIAVLNYYNLGSRDPLLSDKTPLTISAENPVRAESLIDGFKKLAGEKGFLVFLSAKWYVRLQYKDIYDEPHDDLYDVSSGGSSKMSKNEAMELIKEYSRKIEQEMVIDMHTASPEILYEKWKN